MPPTDGAELTRRGGQVPYVPHLAGSQLARDGCQLYATIALSRPAATIFGGVRQTRHGDTDRRCRCQRRQARRRWRRGLDGRAADLNLLAERWVFLSKTSTQSVITKAEFTKGERSTNRRVDLIDLDIPLWEHFTAISRRRVYHPRVKWCSSGSHSTTWLTRASMLKEGSISWLDYTPSEEVLRSTSNSRTSTKQARTVP